MSEFTKAADIKRIIEGKIGQMVEVTVTEDNGTARISVTTLCNHERYGLDHTLTAEEWAAQGYEVDCTAVMMGNLLNVGLLREASKAKKAYDQCIDCLYNTRKTSRCKSCHSHNLFIGRY